MLLMIIVLKAPFNYILEVVKKTTGYEIGISSLMAQVHIIWYWKRAENSSSFSQQSFNLLLVKDQQQLDSYAQNILTLMISWVLNIVKTARRHIAISRCHGDLKLGICRALLSVISLWRKCLCIKSSICCCCWYLEIGSPFPMSWCDGPAKLDDSHQLWCKLLS